jgi:hypothetical protein
MAQHCLMHCILELSCIAVLLLILLLLHMVLLVLLQFLRVVLLLVLVRAIAVKGWCPVVAGTSQHHCHHGNHSSNGSRLLPSPFLGYNRSTTGFKATFCSRQLLVAASCLCTTLKSCCLADAHLSLCAT